MLKIKKGIDLKELEKFGFKRYKEEKPTWKSSYSKDIQYKNDNYTEIGYKLDNGANEICVVESRRNCDWKCGSKPRQICVYECDYEMGVSMWAYDVVFDLIQAGLVEKV